MSNITILGSGSFGIALAELLIYNNHNVQCYCRNIDTMISLITTRKYKAFENYSINHNIHFNNNLFDACKNSSIIIFAIPSIAIKKMCYDLLETFKNNNFYYSNIIFVNAAKGIDEDTLTFLSDIIKNSLNTNNIAILSGPSHAEEIIQKMPTSIISASYNDELCKFIRDIFMNDYFRVYTSRDVNGIELVAALKNVIALAAGICDGLGYGDNLRAALITRGIAEITRLGIAMGYSTSSFYSLAGIGDLIVTCQSMHSRNKRAGILIAHGYTYKEAINKIGMTVEGIYSAKSAYRLANKYNVDMPIVKEINLVLFENKNPKQAINDLMNRPAKESNMF